MLHSRAQQGFSLVELSIVLVILGLLTGGILGGQALIRAAELRSITTDYDKYKTAVMTFRGKYFAYPGDFGKAFDFWGAEAGCTDAVMVNAGDPGCNGNGNGVINKSTEDLRAWQHLSMAGLVEGQYDGQDATGSALGGITVPKARVGSGVFYLVSGTVSHPLQFADESAQERLIMRVATQDGGAPDTAVIRTSEAYSIDMKLDDGKPGTGSVTAYNLSSDPGPCINDGANVSPISTNMSVATATYYLSNDGINCRIQMLVQ
jgi:prepilin-type N-terminal cleavage/methylation domain-containing protein